MKKKKHVELHRSKGFCMAKETINKMKEQATKREKIFTNHISENQWC